MPFKCCVPGCYGNYANKKRVHVFSFPKDDELYEKWVIAIPRENFQPTKSSKVCEDHFKKECILFHNDHFNKKTGKYLRVSTKHPKLKPGSVPTIFPISPVSKSKTIQKIDRNEKGPLLDQHNSSKADETETEEFLAYKQSVTFDNFENFLNMLNNCKLPGSWHKIQNDQNQVTLFKVDYSPAPIINYSVIINSRLSVKTYFYDQETHVQTNNFKTPFYFNNLVDLFDLLNHMDKLKKPEKVKKTNNVKNILDHVCDILEGLKVDETLVKALSFICEQLKLLTISKEKYIYLPETLIICTILNSISSLAYKFLRDFCVLALPHPDSLKTICNSFLTDTTIEGRHYFFTYAKTFKFVNNFEKNMILLVDEIDIKPYLDYESGNKVGSAINNSSTLANKAFSFMMASVCSDFKEVVHIALVSKISANILFNLIKSIICGLEKMGYRIFCVITNNNALNVKAMCHFSPKNELSIVYPHPSDIELPLFYLFSSVHLLKCIRDDWLNSKPDQILTFPDMDNSEVRYASFKSLIDLQKIENVELFKLDYSLTFQALFPNNFERQDIVLALEVFNPFVIRALLQFGKNIDHHQDTANFLHIFLTWWKIVNVKTSDKGKHFKDIYQEPFTRKDYSTLEDPKIHFLNKMLEWLENWQQSEKFSKNLSTQTYMALHHTIYCMLEIMKFCFDELHLEHVLLGKFQTDAFEHRFGKYRELVGSQYNISIRQLYKLEQKLTIQSLMSLKSQCFGILTVDSFQKNDIEQFSTKVNLVENTDRMSWFSPNFNITEFDIESVQAEMPVIVYLGGYCSYIVLKKLDCEICKKQLVDLDDLHIEDNYKLIQTLSSESLKFPKDVVINIVVTEYILFNKILQMYEDEFLNICNKEIFLSEITLDYIKQNMVLYFSECTLHSVESVIKLVLSFITNTLLKTYFGKRKVQLGRGNKRKRDYLS